MILKYSLFSKLMSPCWQCSILFRYLSPIKSIEISIIAFNITLSMRKDLECLISQAKIPFLTLRYKLLQTDYQQLYLEYILSILELHMFYLVVDSINKMS